MAPTPPALHPDLRPLAFLLGTWSGGGRGAYPTIADFEYAETATYSHVGKPFVAYVQRTTEAASGLPLHTETGYLRPVGPADAEMVLTQPSGIMELHHVSISGTTLEMTTTEVVRTPTSKPVAAVKRVVSVLGDTMRYQLEMAAMGLPLQFHLEAELTRVDQ